jgi:thiamine pyrophosphokinase
MKIKFTEPCFLIGAGQTEKKDFLDLYKIKSPLVAVDGGANSLNTWKIKPDIIIGDMDSVEDLTKFKQSQILKISEQNTSDLEKCLLNIEAPLFLAFGFIGSRFDHGLEILHISQKYPRVHIIFFSEDDAIFLIPKKWEINLPLNTRISLYPLSPTKIKHSEGFKYPLGGLTLEQGNQIGTSNENIQKEVSLEKIEGTLLGIIPKKFNHLLWT